MSKPNPREGYFPSQSWLVEAGDGPAGSGEAPSFGPDIMPVPSQQERRSPKLNPWSPQAEANKNARNH